jgi:hypothetical protein
VNGALIFRIDEHRTSMCHAACGTEMEPAVIFKRPMKAKDATSKHRAKSREWKKKQQELRKATIAAVTMCKQQMCKQLRSKDCQQSRGPGPTGPLSLRETSQVPVGESAAVPEAQRGAQPAAENPSHDASPAGDSPGTAVCGVCVPLPW